MFSKMLQHLKLFSISLILFVLCFSYHSVPLYQKARLFFSNPRTQPRYHFSSVSHEPCQKDSLLAFDSRGRVCVGLKRLTQRDHIYRLKTDRLTFVVCAPPKTGSTVQLRLMHRINGEIYSKAGKVHLKENQDLINLDNHEEEVVRLFLNTSIPKYQIVRNPIQRTLSAYIDKIERKGGHTGLTNSGPQAFKDWVYINLKPGMDWRGVNAHWKLQSRMCGFQRGNLNSYFHKLKFEDENGLADYMYSILPHEYLETGWGWEDELSINESFHASERKTVNTNARFFDYVDDMELFEYLQEVYQEDINNLNYKKEVDALRIELLKRLEKNRRPSLYD